MNINKDDFFHKLYSNIDGSSISWKVRNKMSDEDIKHLIYGEINFDELDKIYSSSLLKPFLKNVSSFCDLGSGTGRIVVGTSLLLSDLKGYVGIEFLKELWEKSLEVQKIMSQDCEKLSSKIHFINNDFFNVNLSEFNMIFMHYPMKNAEELYLKLEEKMKSELKDRSVIISAIRKLRNTDIFPCIGQEKFRADYGDMTIYYHVKYEKNN